MARSSGRSIKYLTITLVILLLLFLLAVTSVRRNTEEMQATAMLPTPITTEVLLNVGDSAVVDASSCSLSSRGTTLQQVVTCEPLPPGQPTPPPVFVATPAGAGAP